MIWGEESQGDTERFEARTLDPAEYADLENSGVLGVDATTPEVDPTAEGAGLVEVEGSGGGTAWRRRLSPRHRRAVRTFFDPDARVAPPETGGSGDQGAAGAAGEDDER